MSMGWDPSPRTCQSDIFRRADYPYTPILVNNSPELFQQGLRQTIAIAMANALKATT